MNIPLNPFLIALYPFLYFFSKNLSHFPPNVIYKPMLIAIGIVFFLLIFTSFIFRNVYKASIYSTFLIIVLFLPYNIVPKFLQRPGLWSTYVFVGVVALVGLVLMLLVKKYSFCSINKILNVMALILIALPMWTIGKYYWALYASPDFDKPKNIVIKNESDKFNNKPNIYYIILDAYSCGDYLKKVLNYDNSSFIDALEDRGFYVARKSFSSYRETMQAIASNLNLDYIDSMDMNAITVETWPAYYCKFISDNLLFKVIKDAGYKIISINSGCVLTTTKVGGNIDLFICDSEKDDSFYSKEFVDSGFRNTIFHKLYSAYFHSIARESILRHARVIKYGFKALSSIPEKNIESPYFVFFHVLCPHEPFIYDESGNINHVVGHLAKTQNEKWGYFYTLQLAPLNARVLEAIDSILAHSETPPIIIIQGDHGCRWWPKDAEDSIQKAGAYGILNAFYVPEKLREEIREDIIPVNTFRILINYLFGEKYKMLPYKAYSTQLKEITSEIKKDWAEPEAPKELPEIKDLP